MVEICNVTLGWMQMERKYATADLSSRGGSAISPLPLSMTCYQAAVNGRVHSSLYIITYNL